MELFLVQSLLADVMRLRLGPVALLVSSARIDY